MTTQTNTLAYLVLLTDRIREGSRIEAGGAHGLSHREAASQACADAGIGADLIPVVDLLATHFEGCSWARRTLGLEFA